MDSAGCSKQLTNAKMVIMKKYIIFIILSGFIFVSAIAQDAKEKDQPVSSPFENGMMIDAQTTYIPAVKSLEFVIQHKFGTMDNGLSDLFGLYSSANVRLGLNYVLAKNLQIGAGLTRYNMYTDLNAKWTILEQTEKNSMPVAITLLGNVAIDGRNESDFGTGLLADTKGETSPTGVNLDDRFSYFSQLLISRKFCDWFSLQAGASFTHYNVVGWDYDHDIVGAHVSGRIKFSPQSSLICTYDAPLKIEKISEQTNWDTHAKPSLSFGVEISTFTHAFQIYAGNANGILPQHNLTMNQNKPFDGLAFGFTITRLWMF